MLIRITNGTPETYTIGQLRRDNPNVSFPKDIPAEMLASFSVYPCVRPDRPVYDYLVEQCFDAGFEQDADGNWVLGFSVEPIERDQAEANIRSRRDKLLQDSDWITSKSYETGEPVPSDWASYRQALRDTTAQEGFPYSVTWPTKPE